MFESLTKTLNNLENTDPKVLSSVRNLLFVSFFVEMFFIYWFLEWKRLSLALFIVSIISLVIVLLIERRQGNKMMDELDIMGGETEEETEEETKEDVKESKDDEESGFGFDTGLPSAEEYEKRMEKAIGL